MQTKKCSACGQVAPMNEAFCSRCGQAYPARFADAPATPSPRPVLAPLQSTPYPYPVPAATIAKRKGTAFTAGSIMGCLLLVSGFAIMGNFMLAYDVTAVTDNDPQAVVAEMIERVSDRQCGCIIGGAITISGAVFAVGSSLRKPT